MKGCVSVSKDEREIALLSKCRMVIDGDEFGMLNFDLINVLKEASLLVQELIGSKDDAFELYDGKGSGNVHLWRNIAGRNIWKLIKMNIPRDKRFSELYKLEPYIELAVQQMEAAGFYDAHWQYKKLVQCGDVEVLNDCVGKIRQKAKSKQFQSSLKNYQRSSNKNYKELTEYVDALFERYSRLLVLRVDLGYQKQHSKTKLAEAKQDREHLFRNTRSNKLFDGMVGYVWKLEHGPEKGFHYHMMFFFDGAKVREDGTLVKRIGRYWLDMITKGRGVYYNCNADKSRYKSCGIGMVDHRDSLMRDTLTSLAVPYLTKTDLYMKLQTIGRGMGKMERPRQKDSRGRPRAVLAA